jgi:hypothetical protein
MILKIILGGIVCILLGIALALMVAIRFKKGTVIASGTDRRKCEFP